MNKEIETFIMLSSDNLKDELKQLTCNGKLTITLLIKTQWGSYNVVSASYDDFSNIVYLEQFSGHYDVEDIHSYAILKITD